MKRLLSVFLLFLPLPLQAEWKTLASGLDYESRPELSAHVFRIDPAKFRIGLLTASDFSEKALSAADYRSRGRAVLAVNGGFFDETFQAMGLLYRDGQALNPLRNAAWGVFSMSAGGAKIFHRSEWNPNGVSMALQVGPRLVVDGMVQKFKEAAPDRRSAVGVTADGKVVIAVADKPMPLPEWAVFLKKDCPNALNLDGGNSTQIAAEVEGWSLTVEGLTAVPNAVAVFPR
ncbi:MAG TPA: phosphodiester glycosidase family protein [bacterium]|nr:phosphodiester glycosidase family protein [bacterium]